ncbi:glycoside hydrolase family 43 protein [Poronia punctata]|nr:glycoside hydrolase family 43 protein [Poronia punctata]
MLLPLSTVALAASFAQGLALPHEQENTSLAARQSSTFNNPVLWEDLADLDVFRVDDAYYYSSSTMHYSPGAPILRSYDLVNWEYVGHSVPTLDWGSKYNMEGGERAYVKGIWASSLRYRPSNGKWYWIGCIEFGKTYIYTSDSETGPFEKSATLDTCLYDCGILIDDDDTMYVAYGNTQISVAQLDADGLSIVKSQEVFSTPGDIGTLEGSRMYKRDGQYYILTTRPANQEWVLKSSDPFGNYDYKILADGLSPPVGGGGNPHQGGLVDTSEGDWYYMAFEDAYPGGRIPVLAPVTWGDDGFPAVTTVDGAWGQSYDMPLPEHEVPSTVGTDSFEGSSLAAAWEWNHNPDTNGFEVSDGLTLKTVSVTTDLYSARNTLTRRIHGPKSTATIVIDVSNMADGDVAGLSLLRDQSAWIGVRKSNGGYNVAMTNSITMDSNWATNNEGSVVDQADVSETTIYLRGTVDITPGSGRTGSFSYSTDGDNFTPLGDDLTLNSDWQFFMGYRWGIFNVSILPISFAVPSPLSPLYAFLEEQSC